MNDRRKARLLRELVGDEHDLMPDADRFVRIASVAILVLFVVVFSGTYPG